MVSVIVALLTAAWRALGLHHARVNQEAGMGSSVSVSHTVRTRIRKEDSFQALLKAILDLRYYLRNRSI